MASVKLEHIYKVYTGGTKAVTDLTMEMKDGEFIVLVGPSGCGKSTTLRMIAGLEEITAGELYIGDQIVNDMEPKDRDIAMVFQNYALYPQMTVYENMAFGLRLRHVPNDVIQSKVMWAANILGLTELLDRKPRAMSGGQRQRVALGRAILRDPKVMLLDEPLSNLDAKLRASMRTEIAKLHQRLKTTFIYVTHDQTEAMTLGDRVLVMKKGMMQQFDTPKNLYNYPSNKFVAGFIGTPQMNFYDGYLTREGDIVRISLDKAPEVLEVPFAQLVKVNPAYLDGKHHVTMGVRCEHLHIVPEGTPNSLRVKVNHFEELGAETLIYGNIGTADSENITDSTTGIIIRLPAKPDDVGPGSVIHVTLDVDHTYFFDFETEETIVPRIPTVNAFDCTIRDGKLEFLGQSLALPEKLSAAVCESGTLDVPNDGFVLGQGPIHATVLTTEMVNETALLHIDLEGRTFFALADRVREDNSPIDLDVDWSRIRVTDKDGKVVIDPVQAFDEFHAAFLNYKTVQGGNLNNPKYPEFATMRQEGIDRTNAEYDQKRAKLEEDFQRTLASVTPEEFKKLDETKATLDEKSYQAQRKAIVDSRSEKFKAELATKIADLKAQIGKVRSDNRAKLSQVRADHRAKTAQIKADNKKLYATLKQNEVKDYKQFLATNKDKDTIRRRKDEYHIFRETFADQKNNALEQALKGEDMVYDNQVAQTKAETKRSVANLKKQIADAKEEVTRRIDPVTYLTKAHQKELDKLESERREAVNQAGLVFFFGIGDFKFPSTPTISGKLIQGLGTRVFTKNYLVEVPHDAYRIADRGVPAAVVGVADYGEKKYAVCSYYDSNGQEKTAYVLTSELPEVGTNVKLAFDISRSRITETGMGIRLY